MINPATSLSALDVTVDELLRPTLPETRCEARS